MSEIADLIVSFSAQLTAAIQAQTLAQTRAAVLGALGDGALVRRGPGRPPKSAFALVVAGKTRKKPPVQFCPVPYCRNVAAPVFGMVCGKHRDVAKSKIKAYRAARRAKKAKAAA
jgi:hypothetical protein